MKLFRFIVLALALNGAGVGCSVPDMQISSALQADAQVRPVIGRSAFRVSGLGKEKGFGFGEYRLEEIKRSWTSLREPSGADALLQVSEAYQKYSFALRDTIREKTRFIQAAALRRAKSVEAAGISVSLDQQRDYLKVAFRSPESGPWVLELADPGNYMQRLKFRGKLQNGQDEIEVKPLYQWSGRALPSDTPLGYEFSKDGRVLASVQTINNGKVWIRNSLSPDLQMVLASSCGALLLYQQLGEDL